MQAIGLGQLAKEHLNVLVPRGEALGAILRPAFMNQPQKGAPATTWRLWLNKVAVNFMVETP